MNTHKIKNVVDPTLAQDAATKSYVDTKLSTGGTSLITSEEVRYLDYRTILNELSPKFWISAFYARGLKESFARDSRNMNTELSGTGATFNGSTFATVADPNDSSNFYIRIPAADTLTYIRSTQSFLLAGYTFIIIAARYDPTSISGRVLTSATGNKLVGWWGVYMRCVYHDEDIYGVNVASERTSADSNIHMFIYRVANDTRDFWDGDTKLYTGTKGANTDWGNLVVGCITNTEGGSSNIYEVIAFDSALSDTNITTIKKIYMKYFKNISGITY